MDTRAHGSTDKRIGRAQDSSRANRREWYNGGVVVRCLPAEEPCGKEVRLRGLYRRGNVWWVDFAYQGRRYRESIGPNKKLAQAVLEKRRTQLRENRFFDIRKEPKERFDSMAEEYLRYSEANKRSFRRDAVSVKHLGSRFGGKWLKDITPKAVEDYKIARSQQVKPATVNRELACLRHVFSMAMKWGKADANPVKEVRLFREPARNTRVLSADEETKLLSAACEHLRPMIVTALEGGMRRGEVLSLRWKDVDFRDGYVTVRDTKNDEIRQVPMSQRLTETLGAIDGDEEYVFCKEDGTPYSDPKNSFRAAVRRAGIEYCRFHDLRHTFATRLVMSGVDLVTVKELLGHKTLAMTVRYSHPTPEHKKWAIETLNLRGTSQSRHTAARDRKTASRRDALNRFNTDTYQEPEG